MLALAMLLGSIPFGHIAVCVRRPRAARHTDRGGSDDRVQERADGGNACQAAGGGHSSSVGGGRDCPPPTPDTIRAAVGWPGLILVVALNIAKGFVPVHFARTAGLSLPIVALVGIVAILSHDFSYWLMFRPSGRGGSVVIGAGTGVPALKKVTDTFFEHEMKRCLSPFSVPNGVLVE